MTPAGEIGMVEQIIQFILIAGVLLFLLQAMGDFIGGVVRFMAALVKPVVGNSYHVHLESWNDRPQEARKGDPLVPDEDENAGWIQGEVHRRTKN